MKETKCWIRRFIKLKDTEKLKEIYIRHFHSVREMWRLYKYSTRQTVRYQLAYGNIVRKFRFESWTLFYLILKSSLIAKRSPNCGWIEFSIMKSLSTNRAVIGFRNKWRKTLVYSFFPMWLGIIFRSKCFCFMLIYCVKIKCKFKFNKQ